jgi:hypothetical protein
VVWFGFVGVGVDWTNRLGRICELTCWAFAWSAGALQIPALLLMNKK